MDKLKTKRINGEGSVFIQKRKRKDGTVYETFVGEVLIGYDENNKKKTKRVYGKSKEEVIEKIKKILFEQQEGKLVLPSTIIVDDYITNWLQIHKKIVLRPSTYTTYDICITKYIIPYVGKIKLQELNQNQIQRMINDLHACAGKDDEGKNKKGLSPATLRKIKFVLSQCIEQAIDDEILIKNVVQKVKLPKMEKPLINPFTIDDMKKIFEVAKNNQNMRIGIELDFSTGLRRGELLALTWQDVNLETGTININKQLVPTKNGTNICKPKTLTSIRQVSIPDKIITELKRHKIYQIAQKAKLESDEEEYFDENLVICQDNGKHFHPRDFALRFDRIQKKSGY